MKDKAQPIPRHFSVAGVAIDSLGWLQGGSAEPALPALIEQARHGHPELRSAALRTLGWIGRKEEALRPTLLPVLVAVLREPDAGRLRATAACALGSVGPGAKDAVPALAAALLQKDVMDAKTAKLIRVSILEALEQMGPARVEAVPALIAVLEDGSLTIDEYQRTAKVLGGIGPQAKAAVPVLTQMRKSPNTDIRVAAGNALEKIQH
jgi:HEAT repeat protein